MKKTKPFLSAFLIFLLLTPTVGFRGCSKPDASLRTVASAKHSIYQAFHSGGLTVQAFHNRGRLSAPKQAYTARKLDAALTAADHLFEEIAQYPVIDTTNKDEVVKAVERFIQAMDKIVEENGLIEVDSETQGNARRWFFVGTVVAQGLRVAFASISSPTPIDKVLISEATATRVKNLSNRGLTDNDALLVQDIVRIGADYLVAIQRARGKTTEEINGLAKDVFELARTLFAAMRSVI